MLARLQQIITLGLLAAVAAWLICFLPASPGLAWAGPALVLTGYCGALALELLIMRWVSRADSAPRPTWAELASAWLGETLTAPFVFCWRQPFFSQAYPDQLLPGDVVSGHRGVVFVHGLFCNRGFWTPWLKRLQGTGHAYVALDLEPPFSSIDAYVPLLDDAVNRVTAATGMPPLLVCHSMGGLAARAWIKATQRPERVFHVVTLGTPHHGTWLARFSTALNGRQMRRDSAWLQALAAELPATAQLQFTCWYSNCDNIVYPCSSATLAHANNHLQRGAGHVHLAFRPNVMRSTLALLDGRFGAA
jgi:pimeloyl-ACP methyl ester carboxylesterase